MAEFTKRFWSNKQFCNQRCRDVVCFKVMVLVNLPSASSSNSIAIRKALSGLRASFPVYDNFIVLSFYRLCSFSYVKHVYEILFRVGSNTRCTLWLVNIEHSLLSGLC